MHFFGLGIHFLLAIFFAIHAVRNRQAQYWLFVLFSFPLLGSIVYFFAIYLPGNQRMQRQGQKLVGAVGRMIDPERELREARQAWEYTPTAQNRTRLAAALFDAGQMEEAAQEFAQCLQGPFANDAEIRLGAARAFAATAQPARALEHLEYLQKNAPDHRAEQVGILHAQTLAASGDIPRAYAAFEELEQRFGGFAVHAEYTIAAARQGDAATVSRLHPILEHATSQWSHAQREVNAELLGRLKSALRELEKKSVDKA